MQLFRNVTVIFLVFAADTALAARLYLNGVEVSNVHDVVLEKVDVHISRSGDIFITAPQYEVKDAVSMRSNYTMPHLFQGQSLRQQGASAAPVSRGMDENATQPPDHVMNPTLSQKPDSLAGTEAPKAAAQAGESLPDGKKLIPKEVDKPAP